MKTFKIIELTDSWLIAGMEIPKKPKTKKGSFNRGIKRTWLDDFVFDLFNFFN